MTVAETQSIRSLFATRRPIDRPIERVIDYNATDDQRLLAEVEEYEVTESVERNLRRFLDVFGHGVRTGQVTEIGIWVSGFYGSGKSSFTKYLGLGLDAGRRVGGRPFYDLLAERIPSAVVRQDLKTLALQQPVAVIMLDLGTEQLAQSSSATVSTVLYWKVLQWYGYSREAKVAQLEFRLDRDGKLEAFRQAYQQRFGRRWDDDHNDPLISVGRADQLVGSFYPQDYPHPGAFSGLRFTLLEDLRTRAAEILELVRRRTGRENVLFLVDEAGQYVAPRSELILNLDGLARSFKELGKGRVWLVATGQQTLAEIVQRAAYNSSELNKLRDRFPISIDLDARDIREITWRRLLSKSAAAEKALKELFRRDGQAMVHNTRLAGTTLFKGDPNEDGFVKLYPFLPQHFDLLLELVRNLARSRGGIGLRSAIRVIQDLLVDTSRVLPAGALLLADAPVGRLATADMFYDTLRADINKELGHVVAGVDRVAKTMPGDELALRLAKAVAALQVIEGFPRTVENLAALLYRQVGDPPMADAVRETLRAMVDSREIGLVEDPQAGGYSFLSEGVTPLRNRRNSYFPTTAELSQKRSELFKAIFEPIPSTSLEGTKTVRAGVAIGRAAIAGDNEEIQIRVLIEDERSREQRRTQLLADTIGAPEWKNAIAWLITPEESVDDRLMEAIRSGEILKRQSETEADKDVAQFLRAERRAMESNLEEARKAYERALKAGTLIFRGRPTAAIDREVLETASAALKQAAEVIYDKYHLVKIRPNTDLAAKFLSVSRLDRITAEEDPLRLVAVTAGRPKVNLDHATLTETLRVFRERLEQTGTGRLQGNALQDHFASAPYGWSKDATRYLFAALLTAGEVVLHTAGGQVQTPGPTAVEAMRSTQAFGKVGVGLRGLRPSNESLDRASTRLERLFGVTVLPLEDQISQAVREQLPKRLEAVGSLPAQLRLLGLAGQERAQAVLDQGKEMQGQDGAAAIGILGAPECSFPDDLPWSEAVAKALANGAEGELQDARKLLRESDELIDLFPTPTTGLVPEADRRTAEEVLASENFLQRLADLRGAVRGIHDCAAEIYAGQVTAYEDDLGEAKLRLEEAEAWTKATDEDRAELAGRLAADLPETAAPSMVMAELRRLLVRRSQLPALERQLLEELQCRVPKEIEDGEPPETTDVDLSSLVPAVPLKNREELKAWLAMLEAQIGEMLKSGSPVRLRVRH